MAFESTLELIQLTEKELGHDRSGSSSQRADILSQLDQAQKIILGGGGILNTADDGKRLREDVIFNFALAATPKIITLRPAITDRTVNATQFSTSITFDAAPDGANSIAGWFIEIDSSDTIYQISAHTAAATTATLDGEFVESNVSAGSCKIFKLQYDFGSSDILRLINPMRSYTRRRLGQQYEIPMVDKEEMLRQFPLTQISDDSPELSALIRENDGTYTVQFSSYPDQPTRVELDYIAVPTDLEISVTDPIIPRQHRSILSYLAAYFLGIRNNDPRANIFLATARNKFGDLADWNAQMFSSSDSNYGKIVPRRVGRQLVIDVERPYTIG